MSFWRRRIALDPANDGEWQRWEEDSASGSDAATETGGGRTIDQIGRTVLRSDRAHECPYQRLYGIAP